MIYLLGESKNDINSSEYLVQYHKQKTSGAPFFDLEKEFALHAAVSSVIKEGLVQSVHDVSEGGVFIALLESAMPNGLGFEINTDSGFRKDAWLFGEAQGRAVVSVSGNFDDFETVLNNASVPFRKIGTVTEGNIAVDGADWGLVAEWKSTYDTALERRLA